MLNKKILLIIATGYTIAIAVLSLISNNDVPHFGAQYEDKISHLIAYAILTLLWYNVCVKYKSRHPVIIAFVVSIIYGIILEVLQGQLTADRDPSFMDIVSNSIGVTIVTLFLTVKKKTTVKKI